MSHQISLKNQSRGSRLHLVTSSWQHVAQRVPNQSKSVMFSICEGSNSPASRSQKRLPMTSCGKMLRTKTSLSSKLIWSLYNYISLWSYHILSRNHEDSDISRKYLGHIYDIYDLSWSIHSPRYPVLAGSQNTSTHPGAALRSSPLLQHPNHGRGRNHPKRTSAPLLLVITAPPLAFDSADSSSQGHVLISIWFPYDFHQTWSAWACAS